MTLTLETDFDAIVAELTRRGFLAGVTGSAAVLGLAACSNSSDSDAAAPSTRKVASANGEIEVPVAPKRIVTTDSFSMAALFDLGITPVGVYSAGEQYVEPQYLERWRKIAKISSGTVGGEIEIEKVAALKPDLILGIDGAKPPYAQLKAIAPTVVLPFNASKAPWRDMAGDTAAAVNQAQGFEQLKAKFTARAAQLKSTYAGVLAKTRWDVLQGGFDNGQFWLYGPQSPIGGILAAAGVRFASATTAAGVQQNVSYEQISKLSDADAIFYYATNTGAPANLGPQLFAQAAFTRLKAKRFGSVYFLPASYSDAMGVYDSLEAALRTL